MKMSRPELLAALVRGTAYILVLAAVIWSLAYLFLPEWLRDPISVLERRVLLFGGLSSVAIAAAFTFWVAKRLRGRFAKQSFEDFGLARGWMRFLREHHTLFGWAALVTATAHSLYFALDSPALTTHAVTGWAAWGAMVMLVAAGMLLNCSMQMRDKPGRAPAYRPAYRRVHTALAALFVVALSLHSAFLAVAFALWTVAAIPTALVWWKRRSRRNMKEQAHTRPREGAKTTGREYR